jgi:hypothetical protein
MIPLEGNVCVRAAGKQAFEIYGANNSKIKSNKRTAEGLVVPGQHANFVLKAESEK